MYTVIIPTRNRIDALIESLISLCSINSSNGQLLVVVADNSDESLPIAILNYFVKRLNLIYFKQLIPVSMVDNWNKGVDLAISNGATFISVLSDRRLASHGLNLSFKMSSLYSYDVLIFDHQTTWLSSKGLYLSKEYTHKVQSVDPSVVTQKTLSIDFDGYTPRLFNCVVNRDFYVRLKDLFGSFVGGASPDINFQCRVSGIDNYRLGIHDSPSVLTNKRFTVKSNGMIKPEERAKSDFMKLTKNIPFYPERLNCFIHAGCLGELIEVAGDQILTSVDWDSFIFQLCIELSWITHDHAIFEDAKGKLLDSLNEMPIDRGRVIKYKNMITDLEFKAVSQPILSFEELSLPANMQLSANYFNQIELV